MAAACDNCLMQGSTIKTGSRAGYTARIRDRIERGGDRVWRFEDFSDLPSSAVAQALSRLSKDGFLERLSKGIYYRSRATAFGRSKPNPAALARLAEEPTRVFPAGLAAANLLGLTTQAPYRREVATSAMSLRRKLVGAETVIHTRRPEAWASLTQSEAAILDVLRRGARTSELPPQETLRKLLGLLRDDGRLRNLMAVAATEPPRVRAMLGALAETMGEDPKNLEILRTSLNPFSRFDFGLLTALSNAHAWQAKGAARP